jgi:hypothetical protein
VCVCARVGECLFGFLSLLRLHCVFSQIHLDQRDLELIRFLGIPKQRIIAFHPECVPL